jgi:hypothetical protein
MNLRNHLLSGVVRDVATEGSAPPSPTPAPAPAQDSSTPKPSSATTTLAGGATADPKPADPSPAGTLAGGAPEQTAEEKAAADAAAKAAETPEEKAAREAAEAAPKDVEGKPLPEKYEFKLPDGYVADEALSAEAQAFFKEHKMSPAQAQAAIDMHGKILSMQSKQWLDTVKSWGEAAKADPVLTKGGFDQTMGVVGSTVGEYGDAEFRALMNSTGVGNHPAMLRFIAKLGAAVGEGKAPAGGGGGGAQVEDAASVLYGRRS